MINIYPREIMERAKRVSAVAYCPYSNYHVGATIVTADGKFFDGVNVENESYGITICAERVAISNAATHGYRPGELEAIAITASPCGACRQWLAEWQIPRIFFGDKEYAPNELLPYGWSLPHYHRPLAWSVPDGG
jgi:cytidine deaminase